MADQTQDVALRIRARDYSQKTLGQLTKIIGTLTEVMAEQQAEAERGEGTAASMDAAYKRLADAGEKLLRLKSLTELFDRQTETLREAAEATEQARKKHEALAAEMAQVAKMTDKQKGALDKAERATARAQKAEDTRRTTLGRTVDELKRFGIEVGDVARVQGTFADATKKINLELERQEKAMDTLPAASRAAKLQQEANAQQAAQQQATAQQEANARKKAAAEREAAAQVVQALQRQADQAIATARGYQSLGRVVVKSTDDQSRYAQSLQQIISPAAAARSTLSGVEKQVADLSSEITRGGKSLKDGAAKLKELGAAQAALLNMGRGIDAYRQQVAVVRESRASYVAAREEVKNLAAQMKAAGTDAGGLGAKLNAAQQNLKAAANALRNATQSARDSREALRQAGINTGQLSAAQERLTATANRTVTSAQQVSAALRQQQQAGKGAASMFKSLSDGGRESLSIFQRLRGEVLALATAYVGVQGTINLAGGAVDAYKLRQQALLKISAVVGQSAEAQNEQWQYMVGLANKLGIELSVVATSYTKFAVAANAVGIGMQETRYIYESIAKAGRVFALSSDDMNGVFKALEQMLSKGQVYAEELRGQLGERLPGAVALFAKGMGMSVQELTKALELGTVRSEDVINFARANAEQVDALVEKASGSVQAAEARLQSAMVLFKLAIADSGFIEHYAKMLGRLTAFLNSAEGQMAAAKLGEAFSQVADAVVYLAENLDTVKEIIIAIGLFKFGQMLVGMAIGVTNLVGKVKLLTAATFELEASLLAANTATGFLRAGLLRLIPIFGLVLASWAIGEWAYETSKTFQTVMDYVGLYLRGAIELLGTLIATIPEALKDAARGAKHVFKSMFEDQGEFVSNTAKLWEDLSKSWADAQDKMDRKYAASANYRMGLVNTEFNGWMAKIDELNRKQLSPSGATGGFADMFGAQTQAPPLTRPGFQFTEDPGGGSTAASREVARLTKEYEKLGLAADKAAKAAREALVRKDLPGRLQLIDEEFAPRYAEARKVEGEAGKQLVAQLDAIVAKRKEIERLEFENATKGVAKASTDKRAKALETLRQEYEKLAASVGKQQAKVDPTTPFEDRLAAQLKAINVQYDQLIAKANKLGGEEGARLAQQFEGLRKTNQELETQRMRLDELDRLEAAAIAHVNIKRAGIEEINALREAGLISEDEQVRRVNELYATQNAEIAKAVTALEQYAMTMATSMTPEQLALINAEIAKMRAGLQEVSGTYTKMDSLIVNGVLDGMISGIEAVAEGIAGIIDGTMTMGDAWSNLGDVIRQFFADFLMQIAKAILQQMILNALASFGGPVGGAASAAGGVAAGVAHDGAVVGSGSMNRTRSAPSTWFNNAPRMHTGGVVGLAPDEVPTILQKGEEVLNKNDPRNVMNGGGGDGGTNVSLPGPVIYNMLDQDELAQAVMSNPSTGPATVNIIRSKKREIKQILGIG